MNKWNFNIQNKLLQISITNGQCQIYVLSAGDHNARVLKLLSEFWLKGTLWSIILNLIFIVHKNLDLAMWPICFENYCQKIKRQQQGLYSFLQKFLEAWICNFEPTSVITDWHLSKELVGFTGTRCSGSRRSMLYLPCVQTCSYIQITCQNIVIWCLPSQMRWLNRNQEIENSIFTWTFVLVSWMEDKWL